jgi:hypothetical protein
VQVDGIVQVFPPGHTRRTLLVDLVRSMRPHVVELGPAGEAELEELDAAARAHLEHPDTLVMSHPIFMTWGRAPA